MRRRHLQKRGEKQARAREIPAEERELRRLPEFLGRHLPIPRAQIARGEILVARGRGLRFGYGRGGLGLFDFRLRRRGFTRGGLGRALGHERVGLELVHDAAGGWLVRALVVRRRFLLRGRFLLLEGFLRSRGLLLLRHRLRRGVRGR